jgi:Leucine-rich repeat (LRR) protein
LNYNDLSHDLPSEIGNLLNLDGLYLYSNQFNSSLPTELGLLTNLTYFGLYGNNFNGALPSELGNLEKLEFLGLFYNKLTSSVPSELGNLKKVYFLGLFNNTLTGSITSELGGMNDLSSFLLYNNHLTGSIPYELGGLSNLVSFQVQNNLLSSSIPTSFSNFDQITNFDASQNILSGPIPYEICNLKSLRFIFLYNNKLSSSMPNCFGDLGKINYIDLSSNRLTGTIPSSISTISTLQQLFLYSNVLDGNINDIFNSSVQSELTNIDLSDNQLTGKLSAEPFFTNMLETFAIVGNCLTGSLPLQICKANQLTVLALDGLHTSEKCQNKFFPFSDRFTSYSLSATIENGIPSCIYNMTNLKTLHLSGNGLKDNIEKIHLGNKLTDFSLSHNILTGIIPKSVQNKVWKNLDLSFNKISGTLNSNISLNSIYSSSIFLDVNRLSGSIPKTFKNVRNISVLNGNLFECTENELPIYDNERLVYECGSQSIIVSFSIWVILALFSLSPFLLYILLECSCKSFINDPKKIIKLDILYHWLDIFKIQDDLNGDQSLSFNSKIKQTNINMLGSVMNSTRFFCFYIVLFIVVIFLPTFGLLSIYFSTYEYKYGWTISSAFLSGIQPGIIILVVFLSLALLIIYLFKINYVNEFYSKDIKKKVDDKTDKNIFKKSFSYLVLISFINGIFVILANVGFVYITITYDSFIITISSIAMSIFKIIWNGFVVSSMISKLKSKMSVNNDNDNISDLHFTSFQVLIAIFNNIIMPCIATALINPNCFYNALIPPPVVTASYDYDTCISFSATTGECTTTGISTGYTFYHPPFTYGYQCSSVLVTAYASVYVYMFIANSFMNPLQSMLIHYLHKSSSIDTAFYKIIDNITDPILKLANKIELDNNNSIDDGDLIVSNNKLNESLVSNPTKNNRLSLLLFNKDTFVVGISSNIAILLTFGVVYPPLSIIILLGIFTTSYCAQLSIGRLYRDCQKNSIYTYLDLLEIQCNGIYYSLKNSILLVFPFSFLFISFFLFDIFGDAIGSSYAFIIMSLVCLIPLALYGILYISI